MDKWLLFACELLYICYCLCKWFAIVYIINAGTGSPRGFNPERGRRWIRSSPRDPWRDGGICPRGDGFGAVTSDGEFAVDILTHTASFLLGPALVLPRASNLRGACSWLADSSEAQTNKLLCLFFPVSSWTDEQGDRIGAPVSREWGERTACMRTRINFTNSIYTSTPPCVIQFQFAAWSVQTWQVKLILAQRFVLGTHRALVATALLVCRAGVSALCGLSLAYVSTARDAHDYTSIR